MKTALGLCERLFVTTSDTGSQPPDEGTESEEESQTTVSLQVQLQQEIDACMKIPDAEEKTGNDLQKIIAKEFALFEATKVRPKNLQCLYLALGTIPPTSVEAERAFSVCGTFVTKVRNRLSDKSINALCFLKSHLLKSQRKEK